MLTYEELRSFTTKPLQLDSSPLIWKDTENNFIFSMFRVSDDGHISSHIVTIPKNNLTQFTLSENCNLKGIFAKPIKLIIDEPVKIDELYKTETTKAQVPVEDTMFSKPVFVSILKSIPPGESHDLNVSLTPYLALETPCVELKQIRNLTKAYTDLNTDFPWFKRVTDFICEHLALKMHGDSIMTFPPILLVGPPGMGKTTYAQCIATHFEQPIRLLSLAGKSDSRSLVGSARGWSNASPSDVIRFIEQYKIANPIILLDEVDKAGGARINGAIHDALIPLLERTSALKIYDEFICTHANLSYVNYIATANTLETLPEPLLARFHIIKIDGPEPGDYKQFVMRYLQNYAAQNHLDPRFLPFPDELDWELLKHFFSSPRRAIKAVDAWLAKRLTKPRLGQYLH